MSQPTEKVVQYLAEAAASEFGQVRVLQSQIATTSRGSYRDGLQEHLRETRDHARRVQERLQALDTAGSPLQSFVAFTERMVGETLALSKLPLDLLRVSGGEEKVLKQAKDACASEALEIATYDVLERLAIGVDDRHTAELAASIRGDEQRMLERILRELPELTAAVVAADIEEQTW
jgi:ferritin-like metal-binding protein YciE